VLHGPFAAGVVVVAPSWTGRALTDVVVELEQERRVLARSHLAALGDKVQQVVLRVPDPKAGRSTIVVRSRGRVLFAHTEQMPTAEL
jgi:hypothetical protein